VPFGWENPIHHAAAELCAVLGAGDRGRGRTAERGVCLWLLVTELPWHSRSENWLWVLAWLTTNKSELCSDGIAQH